MGDLEIVRPCGLLDAYFAYRYARGFYRGVGVVGRYAPAPDAATLTRSIAAIALQQPMLRVGLVDELSAKPSFVRAPSIDLAAIVGGVKYLEAHSVEEYDDKLLELMARMQDAQFDKTESVVLWRGAIVRPSLSEVNEDTDFVDVVFVFHHAISDGMGGVIFHEALRNLLNGPLDDSALPVLGGASGSELALPEAPPVLPPINELIPFTVSWGYFLKEWWNSTMPAWLRIGPPIPDWWNITLVNADLMYTTILHHAVLPGPVSASLAAECKVHGVGVASLLNALLAVATARRMPENIASRPGIVIRGDTTISMRPWIDATKIPGGIPPNKLITTANTAYTIDFPPEDIAEFRSISPSSTSLLDDAIWRSARTVMAIQCAKLSSLPADDPRALLPYSGDIRTLIEGRMAKSSRRHGTYEIGSLGAVDGYVEVEGGKKRHVLRRLAFANPSQPQSAALMLNVAGIRGGDMVMVLSYGEGHMAATFADQVLGDIVRWASAWAEGGSFGNNN